MNPKTCLILATSLEAKPILSSIKCEKLKPLHGITLYRSGSFDLAIVGVGPTRSAISMGVLSKLEYENWVNLGVAGALSDQYGFGALVEIKTCLSRDDIHPFDRSEDQIEIQNDGAILLTVGNAVHENEEKQRCAEKAGLVDMEGYSIAMAAKRIGVSLKMFKVISDDASNESVDQVVKNIPQCMQKLWNKVEVDIFG